MICCRGPDWNAFTKRLSMLVLCKHPNAGAIRLKKALRKDLHEFVGIEAPAKGLWRISDGSMGLSSTGKPC